ncbi:MAX dimerization protein MGA a isoform X2 [Mastacembelus armatus]|uniref:MAX dimerization protein MGA a isoform X2 n=1 Tax=Mastacembelus armatus TaxID=205130 RepID=UPI000E45B78E|nr:uncharacterized protein LOC113131280 isoform X2 [Mastacembelus armatus]
MASKKKQKDMVFHEEGASTPAAAPAANHSCFVVPKLGMASEGGMEQETYVTNEEANIVGKPNMHPSKEVVRFTGGLPTVKQPISSNSLSDNLSPDSVCKGVRVILDNNSMWNEFFRCKTEMILTKQGSRMFPYCRFRISGLHPHKKYSLIMDIQPLDNSCYKWTGKSWQVVGKAECHVKSQPFNHPESPSVGQHWMQNPVSFYKLKLTNNISDQDGNTILHPMHRYLPRLHVVQTDKASKDVKLNGPNVVTFTFPQTEFMAVMSYQNLRFAQLKVACNPFAKGLKEDGHSLWGLKMKLNTGKESHKDGGVTTNELHPVKKSLKSLLANHKPRSSKAMALKPSPSGDLQKNSTADEDQSADKVTGQSSCSSHPAQKLFSELIREAHVSLKRCNLEQLGINNRTERTNIKTTGLKSDRQEVLSKDCVSVITHSDLSVTKEEGGLGKKRQVKEDKHLLNSVNCKDKFRTDGSVQAAAAMHSDQKCEPETVSAVNVKQHKRPAPLPLPALALFLKQHSTKTKKSKPESPSSAQPSSSLSGSQSSAVSSSSDHARNATSPSKDLTGNLTKSDNLLLDVTGQAVETALQPFSLSCSHVVPTTDPHRSKTESPVIVPQVPDDILAFSTSNQPFCAHATSTFPSTLTTSSAYCMPPVLPTPKLPQTPNISESSALLSDSTTMKSDTLLHDPGCSHFVFEPLSPASSPEPLPALPSSLGLELEPVTSEPPPKALPPEELKHSENCATSVFQWHTVLPPPAPYMDASFQPTAQPLPLVSVTPPLLPSQRPSHPEPQIPNASTPPPEPSPSFQENEQSLPFPAELSPLALQLPLSPTFSSLDGDGLSPTPSIADLVQFFSTDDLGMGVEYSNTEAMVVSCSPSSTIDANAHEPSQQVQQIPAAKTCKRNKKSKRRKLAKMDLDQEMDDASYARMQPNLEEVEEQLFISFTSKEALQLHIADSSEGAVTQLETTPGGRLQQPADTPENAMADNLQDQLSAFQRILLRDLKLMKHKQVIHPVLQEVGLKMNLLDPTLTIDLQYLGVQLPIPPAGVSLELLPPSQGVSAEFVSRTGKTTDVTQIKGWREKFTPSEAPPTPTSAPEAGPSSDLPKKNLSAFCSDMLDEYLENEGKLIDERAASFSQPQLEPVVYELPTRSTSYVRTLDNILKKQTLGSPTSDLISGFIPPSKRPSVPLKEKKTSRKGEKKPKGPKQTKPRPERASAPVLTPEPNLVPKWPAPQTPAAPHYLEHTAPLTEPHHLKKRTLKVRSTYTEPLTLSPQSPPFTKRKKLKPKTSSQTLSLPRSAAPPLGISEDMAPLESDSELGNTDQEDELCRKANGPVLTRALLRQRDLEDGVVWEGQPRTKITEERATIALTSLFTLKGFVSENPTAPIQLIRRRAPPCLNDFCRLGCVCSSLSYCFRISHCGRAHCIFGCSCLKQKVVLLKNLDGYDSSSSDCVNNKKSRRKRRMKMAYILKEADNVSHPSARVQTLWKRDGEDPDPEPVYVPEPASLSRFSVSRENSSCARVQCYSGRRKTQKQNEATEDVKSETVRFRPLKRKDLKLMQAKNKPSSAATDGPVEPTLSSRPESPPSKLPSKRLIILAQCQWASDTDRNHVLKKICEAMAQDQMHDSFWIKKYFIKLISRTVEESGTDRCIQYKIHISTLNAEQEKPASPVKPHEQQSDKKQPQDPLRQAIEEEEPLEDHQQEVMEEEEPLEYWQREVEDGDIKEDERSTLHQVADGKMSGGKIEINAEKTTQVRMALPFLTGISPAGFLSANKKQPGGTDQLVQVNGKLYPLAKVQLGKMGALHPANRLAAYLTGRVGFNKKQQGSSSSASSTPTQTQSSALTPQSIFFASSVLSVLTPPVPPNRQPSGSVLALPTSATVGRPAAVKVAQSAATSSNQPEGQGLKEMGTRFVRMKVHSNPVKEASALSRGLPAAPPQTPTLTFVKQGLPLTTATTSTCSGPSLPSSVQSSVSGSSFQAQEKCSFRTFPINSSKESAITTKVPSKAVPAPECFTFLQPHHHPPAAPMNLISLKPSTGQGAELGVKTVTVSVAAVGRGGAMVRHRPASSQSSTCAPQTPREPTETPVTPPSPLRPGSEITPVLPADPPADRCKTELAHDVVDLDIVCVEDDAIPVTMEMQPVEDLTWSSGGETDNSSDFGDESDNEGEQLTVASRRNTHNMLERQRRRRMRQLFDGLRRELGLNAEKVSKVSTLHKAVQVIEEMRKTENNLKKKKMWLMKSRDDYLSKIIPATGESSQKSPQLDAETRGRAGRKIRTDMKVMEVVNLLDDSDELTDNSSDEERLESQKANVISSEDEEVQCVSTETDDDVQCVTAQTEDDVQCITAETEDEVQCVTDETEDEVQCVTAETEDEVQCVTAETEDEVQCVTTETEDEVQCVTAETEDEVQCVTAETEDEVQCVTDETEDEVQRVTAETEDEVQRVTVESEDDVQRVTAETEDEVQCVTVEIKDEVQVTMATKEEKLKRLANMREKSKNSRSEKMTGVQSITATHEAGNSPQSHLVEQSNMDGQKDANVTRTCHSSGKHEQIVMRTLQYLSSKQKMEKQDRPQTANQLSVGSRGGASAFPARDGTNNVVIIKSPDLQQQIPQAPPTLVSAKPTSKPVQQPPVVLQVMTPMMAPPIVSHNTVVVRDKPRTIPNILSRSKNLVPSSCLRTATVDGKAPSFQALAPTEVLTLVRAVLPGKPVLTLSPLLAGSTVLPTTPRAGVTSVTLNFPNLTNQQVQLSSLPRPPAGKICSSSTPLNITNLLAANFNNLLQLVQPATTQQRQLQQTQLQPQQLPQQQTLVQPQQLQQQQTLVQPQQLPQQQTLVQPQQLQQQQTLVQPQQLQQQQTLVQPQQLQQQQTLVQPQQLQQQQTLVQPQQLQQKQTLVQPQQLQQQQTLVQPQQLQQQQTLVQPQQLQQQQTLVQPQQLQQQQTLVQPQQLQQQQTLVQPQQLQQQQTLVQPQQLQQQQTLVQPQQLQQQQTLVQPQQLQQQQTLVQPQQLQQQQTLVQPQQLQQQQTLVQPQQLEQQQTQLQPQQLEQHSSHPPLVVSAGSDQIKSQNQPPCQTDLRPDCTQGPPSSLCPSLGADDQVEDAVGRAAGLEQQETRGDSETASLSSLLDEIVFLNQQTAGVPLPEKQSSEVGRPRQQDHTHSPLFLHLECDNTVSMEMVEAGLNGYMTPTKMANWDSKGDVLAPPPLQQMKTGGAKVDPSQSDNTAAVGEGRRKGGVAWRPMPRLVPLGLRGNPSS